MSWNIAARGLLGFAAAVPLVLGLPDEGRSAPRAGTGVWHVDPLPPQSPPAAAEGFGATNPVTPESVWRGFADEKLGTADRRVPCVGSGTDGARIEVIYAHPSDYESRFATYRTPIQILVANVNREVLASAGETRGLRQLRIVTTSTCVPLIRHVKLGLTSTQTDFNAIASDLEAKGYGAPNRTYLVYIDGKVSTGGVQACGVAGGFTSAYAMISDRCWSDVDDHELAHALGAVPFDAPHATGDGHCTDQHDILCGGYPSAPRITTYPCPWWHHDLLDCGHDDYFHTNPRASSFLGQNPDANVANSAFLTSSVGPLNDRFTRALPVNIGIVWGSNVGTRAEPGEPATAASAPAHSIWYKITTEAGWELGIETYASSVDTVLGVYTGTSVGALTLIAENDNGLSNVRYSRVRLSSTAATTYYIRVDGKNGTVGSVRLNVAYGEIPKISSFTPNPGKAKSGSPLSATKVTLNGTSLLGGGGMLSGTFNGLGAIDYETGDTAFSIYPIAYVTPGPLTLSTPSGFTQTDAPWRLRPQVTGFSPTSGPPGTSVQVRGTGFGSAILPAFTVGGRPAALDNLFLDFTHGYVATIRVPNDAVTGKIGVTTAIGSAASAASFTVP